MAMNIGALVGQVKADFAQFQAGMKKAAQSVRDLDPAFRQAGHAADSTARKLSVVTKEVSGVDRQIGALGKRLMSTFGLTALAFGLARSVKNGVAAVRELGLVSGETEAVWAKFGDTLKAVQVTFGIMAMSITPVLGKLNELSDWLAGPGKKVLDILAWTPGAFVAARVARTALEQRPLVKVAEDKKKADELAKKEASAAAKEMEEKAKRASDVIGTWMFDALEDATRAARDLADAMDKELTEAMDSVQAQIEAAEGLREYNRRVAAERAERTVDFEAWEAQVMSGRTGGDLGEGVRVLPGGVIETPNPQLAGLDQGAMAAIAGGAGQLGAVFTALAAGAGAATAGISLMVSALMQSQTVQALMGKLNTIIANVADSFGALLEPLLPVVDLLGGILEPLADLVAALLAVSPLMLAVTLPLKILAPVLGWLGKAVQWLTDAVRDAVNWFLDLLGMDPLEGPVKNAWGQVTKQTGAFSGAVADSANAISKETEKRRELIAQLDNIPKSFKVDLARYNAVDPNLGRTPEQIMRGEWEGVGASSTTNSTNVVINVYGSTDPEATAEKVKQVLDDQSVAKRGSRVHGAPRIHAR